MVTLNKITTYQIDWNRYFQIGKRSRGRGVVISYYISCKLLYRIEIVHQKLKHLQDKLNCSQWNKHLITKTTTKVSACDPPAPPPKKKEENKTTNCKFHSYFLKWRKNPTSTIIRKITLKNQHIFWLCTWFLAKLWRPL